MENWYFRNYEL